MIESNQEKNSGNLYVASLLALLFVGAMAAAVWFGQVRPALTPAVAVEPAGVEATPAPAAAETAAAPSASGDAAAGQALFASTCSACHGPTGEGIPGLGKDMTTSQFIAEKTDQELVDFIKVGRGSTDPLNTTGVDMPPKGGNPSLDDEDLANIVSYIRTIHK